ncbi:MAG: glycosyltransferase family 4 protein, partial [Nitriliruptorales bacterium]
GQDVLLDAWPRIHARHPDAWMVLVGEGALRRRFVAAAQELPNVVVAGAVAWSELPAAYAALDLFAMPCRTRVAGMDVEGLGIACLEAQSSGVPVVAGRSGGAPETVLEGGTGVVVDGTAPAAVAGAVADLLDDRVRLAAMGRAGRRWVEERWTWSVSAERFRGVLDRVVSVRGAG